jgi:hypothetical protein
VVLALMGDSLVMLGKRLGNGIPTDATRMFGIFKEDSCTVNHDTKDRFTSG